MLWKALGAPSLFSCLNHRRNMRTNQKDSTPQNTMTATAFASRIGCRAFCKPQEGCKPRKHRICPVKNTPTASVETPSKIAIITEHLTFTPQISPTTLLFFYSTPCPLPFQKCSNPKPNPKKNKNNRLSRQPQSERTLDGAVRKIAQDLSLTLVQLHLLVISGVFCGTFG